MTEDGAETDLDIGHYERFVDENLSRNANHTSGSIWYARHPQGAERRVPRLDRAGDPAHHERDQGRGSAASPTAVDTDVVISEIGGTVGDIESLPFLEAIRQFRREVGPRTFVYLHVTFVPFIETAGELKTKPTQHSVNELRRIGIHPDIVVCRSHEPLSARHPRQDRALRRRRPGSGRRQRGRERRLPRPAGAARARASTASSCRRLGLPEAEPDLGEWDELARQIGERERRDRDRARRQVREAPRRVPLRSRGAQARGHPPRRRRARPLGRRRGDEPRGGRGRARGRSDGVLVPGGFGSRGWEGKITACRVARENGIPYLGICLGMQVAISEFARHVAASTGANSTEMDPETPYPVIDLLPEQKEIEDLGGTMRLGADAVDLDEGTEALRGVRRARRPRAPPPPLRGEQPLPAAARRGGPRRLRARSRQAGWSRSSSCPTIPGSSRASSIRSSSRAPRAPRRSSATSSARLARARERGRVAEAASR